jgi:hypothetical protein
LIVLGEAGYSAYSNRTSRKFEELGRWQMPQTWLSVLGRAGAPRNKLLYLRDEDHLVCYDLGKQ